MKYTPDEVAKLLANRPNQPHYVKALIEKCVKAAVLAEREACLQIANVGRVLRSGYTQYDIGKCDMADQIFAAIRARSEE